MFNNYFKNLRVRLHSTGSGVMLSAFLTLLGLTPQPVAAAAPFGFELNIERNGHTATVLQGGEVLIVGGKNTDGASLLNNVEIVNANDPSSAQPPVANIQTARTDHTATQFANGDVLVTGGSDGSGSLNSTEIFSVQGKTWSFGDILQATRSGHTATTLSNGQILIVGGDTGGTAEIYGSPAPVVGSLNAPRSKHSAIRLNDGKVLIVGGVSNDSVALKSAELYDPATSTFTPVSSSLAVARIKPDLRLLQDGKVQVIGGSSDGTFELYDPDANNTKPGFNAKAQAVNSPDIYANTIDEVLNAQTRAAILFDGSVVPGSPLSDILNRNGYAMTEIAQPSVSGVPQASKVLISGGVSSTAATGHQSAYVLDGSPATITTNATDYAPGTDVYVNSSGWMPGEAVEISWQKVKSRWNSCQLRPV